MAFSAQEKEDKIAFLTLFVTVLCYIPVLVKAIVSPGRLYCDYNGVTEISCPSAHKFIRDVDLGFLVVFSVVYAMLLFFAVWLVVRPGKLMRHPHIPKFLALLSIFLIVSSIILLFAPVIHRSYVIPFNSVQNFTFHFVPGMGMNLSISGMYYNSHKGNSGNSNSNNKEDKYMFRVIEAFPHEKNINDIPPARLFAYSDRFIPEELYKIASSEWKRTVDLSNYLKHSGYYLFEYVPARGSNHHPRPTDNFLIDIRPKIPTHLDGSIDHRHPTLLDKRAYLFCFLYCSSDGKDCICQKS